MLFAVQIIPMIEVYRGAAKRRARDVSRERRPPLPQIQPLIADLVALGFERLGEAEITVPSTTGVGPYTRRKDRHTTWVFVDSQDTTVVDVVPIGPLAAMATTLADGSVVETMYPRGEKIDDPDLWSSHVKTSLAAAYQAHRVAIDKRVAEHGQPREVHNIADYLRLDAHYRERFAHRVLRGPFIRNTLIPSGIVVGLVVLATIWLLGGVPPSQ